MRVVLDTQVLRRGAVAGHATCLVTADHDLLSLRDIEGIPIMDIPTFWTTLSVHLRESAAPE